jgi:exonuclease III
MASLCGKFGLVDVLDTLHPEHSHIPSYARSSNRLDYALMSQDLLTSVDHAGLNHYHEFYPSDHRPLFVGLNSRLFGPLPSLAPHQS